MTVAGIIAEYNPFHNGHAFLLREMRRLGADRVAVVMSGNFVQRGEPAVLSKWARTKQALACGADLVVELPLPWAAAGAERFALGGVSLLTALGADVIGFGSECGEIAPLKKAGLALSSPLLHSALQARLREGMTFAAARQQAAETLFGAETALLFREPNNILGIEYLKAIDRLGSGLEPQTVRRMSRRGGEIDKKAPTSSAIRAMMIKGENFSAYVPELSYRVAEEEAAAGRAPADLAFLGRGVLADLRRMDREKLSRLPDVSEGLENRIFAAAQKAGSLPELLRFVKTKRYPMARIRRIILSAFLGVGASDSAGTPPYLRVLGIGEGGAEILRKAKQTSPVPVISRYAEAKKLGGKAERTMELENRASDLYALCMPDAGPCGLDRCTKLVVV